MMDDLVERLAHCSENTKDEYLHELTGRAKARIEALEAELSEARAECLEQARIIGAGGERELALMAEVARLETCITARDQAIALLEGTDNAE
jgi:hypothetical protein